MPIDRGNKVNLTNLHLRVLEPLIEDPHMPIAEVAKLAGLSAKRVRKIIQELIRSRGILFTVVTDVSAGDVLHVVYRVNYNPQVIDSDTLIDTIRADFQKEYRQVIKSAIEPVLWLEFFVNHLSDSEVIAARIREIPSIELESTIIPYPRKWYRSRRSEWLREKIAATLHSS
jgi:DNA-binding Lrp family transcriptional regulator